MSESERRRVLVVDDDTMMRELLELLLTREGYVAETAESGEEALERLRRGYADVVLADLQMEGITGGALADQVRVLCGDVRVIAMSASAPEQEALGAFDGFLPKPFTVEALNRLLADRETGPAEMSDSTSRRQIVDERIYGQLADCMGERKLAELYSLCLDDTRRRIASIGEAGSRGDDGTCRKQAHSIKGSCSMVGAREMESLAESIEREGIGANPAARVEELLQACNRLERMLIERKRDAR